MGANKGQPEPPLDSKEVRRLADTLVAAEAAAKPIPPLTHRHRALSAADAYAIQFTAAGRLEGGEVRAGDHFQATFGSRGTVTAKFVWSSPHAAVGHTQEP